MNWIIESAKLAFGSRRGLLLAAAAWLVSGVVVADESILAGGAASEGHVMLIGDKQNWDTVVGQDSISSAAGYLSIQHDDDETAVNISWNGGGEAQFFVGRKEPADYSGFLEQDAALVAVIRLDKKPTSRTTLRMGCGYPCGSNADITRLLEALPTDQWVRVSFDLECFADGGLDVEKLDTPLLITTKGELALSVAEVSVVPEAGRDATIRCRD
jgi:beta-glucosidase